MDYQLNDIVEMKKQHPCKKSNQWKIVRMGADIKVKCLGCNAIVMFSRRDFETSKKSCRTCRIVFTKCGQNLFCPFFILKILIIK